MAHVLHYTEWGTSGRWTCGDVSDLAANSNLWWYPCCLLELTPVDYVKLLIEKYNATELRYHFKYDVLIYYFSSLEDCRKFKNFINKKAREKNFIIC